MTRYSLLFKDAIPGVTYYASGSNHAGEVLGFAESGIHVGVSARETRDLTEQALVFAVRRYDARVFVDSGAFAELARDGHESVPPNWPTVLDLYQRLADQIGPALTVVAPDKIGDMDETLRRMRAHGGAVRSLVSCGTEVLIPIQCPPDLAPDLFSAQANT